MKLLFFQMTAKEITKKCDERAKIVYNGELVVGCLMMQILGEH